ncbi:MAG: hypothetical protein Ta2B_28670 [Termitinemataceae bacterium]|nr:MAG: hypothetical protein Ta2B_28670 [Termitinemataceae bacterium]
MRNYAVEKTEYERCGEILNGHLEMLAKIAATQILVREAVMAKDWIEFNIHIEAIDSFSAEIKQFEKQRLELFEDEAEEDDMGAPIERRAVSFRSVPSFYTYVMRFSNSERAVLTETYRKLKMEVAKVQCENNALSSYLQDAQIFIAGIIQEAFPARRSKIYGKNGAVRNADMRSMVINAQL